MNNPSENDDNDLVSKSQLKREMDELQKLGVSLMSLNPTQLATVPLSDPMLDALEEAKRIHAKEAKRRHAQYIGKLIRKTDFEAIQKAVDLLDPSSEAYNRFHQQIEKWRDRLTQDIKEAMSEFLAEFPQADRQRLRQLSVNAIKEMEATPDKRTARKKLFQFLKEVMSGQS